MAFSFDFHFVYDVWDDVWDVSGIAASSQVKVFLLQNVPKRHPTARPGGGGLPQNSKSDL